MNAVIQPAPDPADLSPAGTCLFLDVDGTLVELMAHPDDVRIDPALLGLLQRIHDQLDGALALISGRSLAKLDALFAPLRLPAAGIHGFERRCASSRLHRPGHADRAMARTREILAEALAPYGGLHLEDKGAAIALHYRTAPQLRELGMGLMQTSARRMGSAFELLEGDSVIELKPADLNKATAIEAFLTEAPFAGRTPIYIGDDRTDFDGFGAVRRHGGVDISVGDRVPARWNLPDPPAVRAWLQRFALATARTTP